MKILGSAAVDGGLNITLPDSGNKAPPGYYMLFLVNNQGVPSVAKWIRATPNIVLAGDFNLDYVVDAADYTVWRDGLGQHVHSRVDYDVWKANFGHSNGLGGLGGSLADRGRARTHGDRFAGVESFINPLEGPDIASRQAV